MTHRFDEIDSWRTKVRLSMSKRSYESYQRSGRLIILFMIKMSSVRNNPHYHLSIYLYWPDHMTTLSSHKSDSSGA